MADIIIQNLVEIAATLLIMLIGVLGVWLTNKIGKRTELANINAAQQEVINMAQITVGELQQTVVEKLKAANADGKLTRMEIRELGEALINKTTEKMCQPTYQLLNSAGVDINALIRGVGEAWINAIKDGE